MTGFLVGSAIYILIVEIFDWGYHYIRTQKILRSKKKLYKVQHGKVILNRRLFSATTYDTVLSVFQFISIYLQISIIIVAFSLLPNPFTFLAASILLAGRFRALNEIGHNALHGALSKNYSLGLHATNYLVQLPLLLPGIQQRMYSHLVAHHPNANQPLKDPNLEDFKFVGLKAGISRFKFWSIVLYPISPVGVKQTVENIIKLLIKEFKNTPQLALARIGIIFIFLGIMFFFGYGIIFLALFCVARMVFYSWFTWISQLVEHRWFTEGPTIANSSKYDKEIIAGRPTDYYFLEGLLLRNLIFPFGDSYHLIHSLYPKVRYNYLPQIDKILKRFDQKYREHRSLGLIINHNNTHTALSELENRLVRK